MKTRLKTQIAVSGCSDNFASMWTPKSTVLLTALLCYASQTAVLGELPEEKDDGPYVSEIPDAGACVNFQESIEIPFVVGPSPETVIVAASYSSNTDIVRHTSVRFTGSGKEERTVVVPLTPGAIGWTDISINAFDLNRPSDLTRRNVRVYVRDKKSVTNGVPVGCGTCYGDGVLCGGFDGGTCVNGTCECYGGNGCPYCNVPEAQLRWKVPRECPVDWPPSVTGGAPCTSSSQCGNFAGGVCHDTNQVCVCYNGWTCEDCSKQTSAIYSLQDTCAALRTGACWGIAFIALVSSWLLVHAAY